MKYGQIISLFDETGLSPENLMPWIGVSNSTYRRWQKEPAENDIPKEYHPSITNGVYKLLSNDFLSYDSPRVNAFLEGNMPEFFTAAIGRFKTSEEMYSKDSPHQDKVTAVLSNIGSSAKVRDSVDKKSATIRKFEKWGSEWKSRIQLLLEKTTSKDVTMLDRLVAYGALFYLILPLDMVPDALPVFGYIDDFGILGFAAAFYLSKEAQLRKHSSEN